MVTEGRNAGGGEVARAGVLAKLPHSPSGALQLDMDGSEYQGGEQREEITKEEEKLQESKLERERQQKREAGRS